MLTLAYQPGRALSELSSSRQMNEEREEKDGRLEKKEFHYCDQEVSQLRVGVLNKNRRLKL